MNQYEVFKIEEGLYIVHAHLSTPLLKYVGHVMQGVLCEQKDGSLVIRGRQWHVLGFEYLAFRSMTDAVDAAFRRYRHLLDAHSEMNIICRIEGVMPLYRSASYHTQDRDVKRVVRVAKRELRTAKRDYGDSLVCAGISSFTTGGGSWPSF